MCGDFFGPIGWEKKQTQEENLVVRCRKSTESKRGLAYGWPMYQLTVYSHVQSKNFRITCGKWPSCGNSPVCFFLVFSWFDLVTSHCCAHLKRFHLQLRVFSSLTCPTSSGPRGGFLVWWNSPAQRQPPQPCEALTKASTIFRVEGSKGKVWVYNPYIGGIWVFPK